MASVLKTLMVTPDFPPTVGGIQTFLYGVLRHLSEVEVAVVAPRTAGAEAFDAAQPFRVYRAPAPRGASRPLRAAALLALTATGLRALHAERPDVVQCGHITAAGVGLLTRRLYRRPCVVWVHALEVLQARRRHVTSRLLRAADRVIANSRYTAGRLQRDLGVDGARIAIVHPGVDVARFTPDADPRPVRARHGLEGRRVILSVGRLAARERYKGNDVVIRALGAIAAEVPSVAYLVVGAGDDQPRLRALAGECGVDDRVIFAGRVEHDALPGYYAACDVFVMPSREVVEDGDIKVEGFGIALLEASACGKPVVGGRSGGIPDAVVEGVTGLLVNPVDPGDVAAALLRVLTDPGLAGHFGRQGRAWVEAARTWEHAARAAERVLREVGAAAPRA